MHRRTCCLEFMHSGNFGDVMISVKSLPKRLQYGIVLIIILVFLWMLVTPFYQVTMDAFQITPVTSVIVGGIGLFLVLYYSKFKFHLW